MRPRRAGDVGRREALASRHLLLCEIREVTGLVWTPPASRQRRGAYIWEEEEGQEGGVSNNKMWRDIPSTKSHTPSYRHLAG